MLFRSTFGERGQSQKRVGSQVRQMNFRNQGEFKQRISVLMTSAESICPLKSFQVGLVQGVQEACPLCAGRGRRSCVRSRCSALDFTQSAQNCSDTQDSALYCGTQSVEHVVKMSHADDIKRQLAVTTFEPRKSQP